jgi:hypothetical protein
MRAIASRHGYRATKLAEALFRGLAAASDNIAVEFEKSAFTTNFAHDGAPVQSPKP